MWWVSCSKHRGLATAIGRNGNIGFPRCTNGDSGATKIKIPTNSNRIEIL